MILLGECNMDGTACDMLSTTVPLMKSLQELDLITTQFAKVAFRNSRLDEQYARAYFGHNR